MMGLLSKIFGSKKDVSNVDIDNKAKSSVKNVPRNENCIKLMEFASHMEKLLAEDRYIARSDYKKYIDEYQNTGNAIIHKNSPEEKLNIVDNSKLYFVIRDYFRGSVMKNESVVNKLIMFFATYFDAPYEGDDLNGFFNNIAKANYSTMRSDLEDFKREVIDTRTKKSVTIQNEILRSHQEVEIANFLYLNNIEYEYEPIYQYNMRKCLKLLRLIVIPRKLLILPVILFRKIQNRSGNVYYLRKISQIRLLFIHMIARPKAEKEIEEVVPIMQLHMP